MILRKFVTNFVCKKTQQILQFVINLVLYSRWKYYIYAYKEFVFVTLTANISNKQHEELLLATQ